MKKVYVAIGHWRGNKNITSVAITASTKKDAAEQFKGNEFVAYVILTEVMLNKMQSMDPAIELYDQVGRLTSNYRVKNDVTDYIEQCSDIMTAKAEAARRDYQ